MRIILSPSKTKKISTYREEQVKIPQYNSKAQKIAKKIARMSVNDISKKLKLSIDKSKELKNFYKNYDGQEYGHSLKSYDGLAFKNFQSIEEDSIFKEMKERLVILSALYGVLSPTEGIKDYRLDMVNSIFDDKSLYQFWKKEISDYFKNDDFVINLASKEYSKMLDSSKLLTIEFYEEKDGVLKQISANSKKIRGAMAYHIVKNKIISIEEIRKIKIDGYKYHKKGSNDRNLIFIKK